MNRRGFLRMLGLAPVAAVAVAAPAAESISHEQIIHRHWPTWESFELVGIDNWTRLPMDVSDRCRHIARHHGTQAANRELAREVANGLLARM